MDQIFPKSRINKELESLSEWYHVTGAWVAIIFDPVFGITDYINNYDGWEVILGVRFSISAITLVTLLFWKKRRFASFYLVFVPLLLISLQNAFTYYFIDLDAFLGHNINYIALWIGAGMFILWEWKYSVSMVVVSLVASLLFFEANPHIGGQYDIAMVEGGLLLVMVAFFMVALIQTRYQLTVKAIHARLALEQTNAELQKQKELTEVKNKSIMDSIRYAERIQNATLPPLANIKKVLPEAFVLFKPRDVVSGDFYWFWHGGDKTIVAAIDCTGHGVPGAFMSMKGDALLEQIVKEQHIIEPHLVLAALHEGIRTSLKQVESNNNDGMDASMILIDHQANKIRFAGAKNPLIYVRDGEVHTIKGDRVSIGGYQKEVKRSFTPHELSLDQPISLYLFSDGFQDQFGGFDRRRLGIKRMRKLILDWHQDPAQKQHDVLDKTVTHWMIEGGEKQIDDILVIGIKMGGKPTDEVQD